MSSTDDDETLPAPPAAAMPARRPVPRWSIALVATFALFVVGYLLLTSVHVGYFVQSPGSAIGLDGRVEIEGVPSYPSEGEVHFTTVRISSDRATLLDVIGDWLDPSSVLIGDELLLQGRSVDENRAFNQELMQDSQERAKRVALEYLGLDVIRADGALVSQVQPDTPADGKVDRGDAVVAVDGEPVMSSAELVDAIGGRRPGDELELEVRRYVEPDDEATAAASGDEGSGEEGSADETDEADGSEEAEPPTEAVSVTLGEHPDGDGTAFLGVAIVDTFDLTDLPFEIDVDTRAVGGPSAGLALTLSIIDDLTEGELTGGRNIATTGTIGVDGAVGPIGGIEQKAHAVRRAGIDVFIVPAVDADRARAVVGDSVEIVGVETLDDAIEALGELGGETESLALPADLQPAA